MVTSYDRWSERIAAAEDDGARRQLLAEIGAWRAAHLTDIPSLRDAAFAMSRLHMLLGSSTDAVREARSLVSLCQTPPEATEDDLGHARDFLDSLLGKPPRKRTATQAKPARSGGAAQLAAAGRWSEALSALKGKRGPRAELLRTWIVLSRAREQEDHAAIEELIAHLGRVVLPKPAAPEPGPDSAPAVSEIDAPLAEVLGKPVPRKRQARIRALENHALEHPEDIDRLASRALQHHVAVSGLRAPAPWLVGLVGRALATGAGDETRKAVEQLQRRGSYAVSAYQEWPFGLLVGLVAQAEPEGWDVTALRRGVMSREEPTDRRLWTVRLVRNFEEHMVVVASPSEEDYPPGLAERLGQRVVRLCRRVVLLAGGSGNAVLRTSAAKAGARVLEEATPDELLAALVEAPPVPQPVPEPPPEPAVVPADLLCAALGGDELPTVEALVEVLGHFRRIHRAFTACRELIAAAEPARADQLVPVLLAALAQAAPAGVRLPEGTTIAVRTTARAGLEGATAAALADGPVRERFGGPGLEAVLALARALVVDGWSVERVYLGPTGRERREAPILRTLGDAVGGLWRILIRRGDVAGEVCYFTDLTAEGRAAVPQLLLQARPRVVVLPVDPDLLAWYATLEAPEAVGWTGSEQAQVVELATAWVEEVTPPDAR